MWCVVGIGLFTRSAGEHLLAGAGQDGRAQGTVSSLLVMAVVGGALAAAAASKIADIL